MSPGWSFLKTLMGGVVLAIICAVVVAFVVDILLVFRVAAHDSNMSVITGNHIVQFTFLAVFSVGILRLILVLASKDSHDNAAVPEVHQEITNAIYYSRSSQASNSAAPTINNTIGSTGSSPIGSSSFPSWEPPPKQRCGVCHGGFNYCTGCSNGYVYGTQTERHGLCNGTGRVKCAMCNGSGYR